MSDTDEDNFQLYGTLLDPYDEDTIPKKKAFSIEDQIATDEQGRRRFHGAFTGGFSAGFFNTVGSLEGWKPSEFKSSRGEKSEKKFQKPEDFMDEEDTGAFGIAPTVVRATSDYNNTIQRKRPLKADGPIPGAPVLHSLLQPAKDTVGIKLLKKMGWKPGQGIGPRLTKSEKIKANRENKKNAKKVYGCEIPEEFRTKVVTAVSSESDSSEDETELTFAPNDYDPFIYKPKDNVFGMGYSGLDKRPILSSHISLFNPPEFKIRERNNKKVSISGQAFGVGAFEEEDEDIYSRDDMSKYDFELGAIISKKKAIKNKIDKHCKDNILEGFVAAKNPSVVKKVFSPPILPKNFLPKHGVRISRFEPLPETHKLHKYDRTKTMGRHDLTASDRSKIINTVVEIVKNPIKSNETISSSLNTSEEEEKKILAEKAAKITSVLPSTSKETFESFKPFVADPGKQKRYEQYLHFVKIGQKENLIDIHPSSMTDWERERERNEFEQASRLYKPVIGLIFDKFHSASNQDDAINPLKDVKKTVFEYGTPEMREAAKKKMFGPLTRTIEVWVPNSLLCRRFNVPEPYASEKDIPLSALSSRKKNKFNVFDYYEAHKQNKINVEGPEPKPNPPKKSEEFQQNNNKNCTVVTSSTEVNDEIHSEKNIAIQDNNSLKPVSNLESTKTTEVNLTQTSQTIKLVSNTENIVPESSSNSSSSRTNVTNIIPETSFKNLPTENERNSFSNYNKSIAPPIPTYRKSKMSLPEPVIVVPTDPKEKIDLFKAIFLSSSESESDEETEKAEDKQKKITEMKKIVLEEEIVKPKNINPKNNNPENINPKNTNPKEETERTSVTENEKPKSKGIFADLDWSKVNRPKPEISSTENKQKEEKDNNTNNGTYGPMLPTLPPQTVNKNVWKPTFNKTNSVKKDKIYDKDSSSEDEDEWMELDISENSSKKSSKKTSKKHKSEKKTEKSKHKKHKSKHKKKKHSSRH